MERFKFISNQKLTQISALALGVCSFASSASIINDTMEFSTTNHSMWQPGAVSSFGAEQAFIKHFDGGFSVGSVSGGENECVGVEIHGHCGGGRTDTRTGTKVEANAKGKIGIKFAAEASGGSLDVFLPMSTTIDIEEVTNANEIFDINTSLNIDSAASISANAPSFNASVKGLLDIDVSLKAKVCFIGAGCASGGPEIAVKPGNFDLFGIDLNRDKPFDVFGIELPLKVFDTPRNIHLPTPKNPDGIIDEETDPAPVDPTPIIGDVTFHTLKDKTGGEFNSGSLSLKTNQNLLDAGLSLPGLIEAAYGSPGLLHNEFKEKAGPTEVKVEYNILDFQVGPTLGLQQEFNVDPNVTVRLEFDQPITQVVTTNNYITVCVDLFPFGEKCVTKVETLVENVVHEDGIVELAVGDSGEFFFEGAIGNLLNRTYFLDDPMLRNNTSATLDPFMQLNVGCLKVKIVITERGCVVDETIQTNGLVAASMHNKRFLMSGFQEFSFASAVPSAPPVGIPEPSTWYLLLLSGFILLFRADRYHV